MWAKGAALLGGLQVVFLTSVFVKNNSAPVGEKKRDYSIVSAI